MPGRSWVPQYTITSAEGKRPSSLNSKVFSKSLDLWWCFLCWRRMAESTPVSWRCKPERNNSFRLWFCSLALLPSLLRISQCKVFVGGKRGLKRSPVLEGANPRDAGHAWVPRAGAHPALSCRPPRGAESPQGSETTFSSLNTPRSHLQNCRTACQVAKKTKIKLLPWKYPFCIKLHRSAEYLL